MTSKPSFSASRRMLAVQTPVIPQIADLIRAHPGCISLGQGVAWYGPPAEAKSAIEQFGRDPSHHRYGPAQGIPPLLDLIRRKLLAENGISGTEAGRRIVVTAGANMGFLNAMLAITDPGDEVILPLPYYFNQEMALRMLNCVPVPVATGSNYQVDVDRIEAAVTPRTKAVVTISPNNPTGAVYPEPALRAVNALCHERGLYHLSDEAYENFVYDEAAHFSPGSIPHSEQHTISLFSLSKAYGFASWRIGYMVFPAHLYSAVLKVQDTNLICPPLISQVAALGALQVGSSYCREQLAVTRSVREIVLRELEDIREFCRVPRTQGAFYVLIHTDTPLDSLTVAERLIREHGVAVIPGTAFGLEQGCYLRVAYGALDAGTALEGVRRLTKGLRAIVTSAQRSR
jgi:aspartate/methionine/tyrosine aminotransferase